MEGLINFLALIGVCCSVMGIGFLLIIVKDGIKELFRRLKIKYKQKHRFDKSPTAKCYCIDCSYHDIESDRCYLPGISRHTPDNGFCYEANPRYQERVCQNEGE